MKPIFTADYPGANRITICGPPAGPVVTIKIFGDGSYVNATSGRARLAGLSGGCYPLHRIKIERGNCSINAFRDKVRNACVEASKKYHRPVCDGLWGFADEEARPLNNPIPF